jgi:hypothetical protein
MGIKILSDSFGESSDGYYGIFKVISDSDAFDIFTELPDVVIDIPENKVLR